MVFPYGDLPCRGHEGNNMKPLSGSQGEIGIISPEFSGIPISRPDKPDKEPLHKKYVIKNIFFDFIGLLR
jgi:hypothetical protein